MIWCVKRLTLLGILTGITLVGCGRLRGGGGGGGDGGGARQPAALAPVTIEARLWRDDGGGIADSAEHVIRDAATMRDFWERATSTQATPPALAEIDFGRQMVLIVAAGRMSPEDEIRIDSVGVRSEAGPSGGRQNVLAVLYTITENCSRFPGDVYPVEIVRVSRFEGQVRFIGRRHRTEKCS